MDTVFIKNLKAQTCIGIHAWERQIRQTILLDVEMATNIKQAAKHDSITDALDYDRIAKRLTTVIEASQFQLLEALAEHLVSILQNEFKVPWLRLKINKPGAVANALEVGIILERKLAL